MSHQLSWPQANQRLMSQFYFRQMSYLTYWVVVFIIFHKYTHIFFDLHLLTLFTFTGGTYIFYYIPGYLPVYKNNKVYKWRDWKLHLTHIVTHILPLCFIVWLYGVCPHKTFQKNELLKSLFSICLLFIYYLFTNYTKIYHIQKRDIVVIVILTFIVYISLFIMILCVHSTDKVSRLF